MSNSFISKVLGSFKKPENALMYLSRNGFMRWMPDEVYIKLLYRLKMKKSLNLNNPTTFTEKIQWLKLYDHNPKYTVMVDKVAAKDYVAKIIGQEYVVPTFGKWDNVDDINFDSLPNSFVLKVNHDSGGVVICKDKKEFDIKAAKKKLKKCLKNNGYWYGREWPYKNIIPCIFAEEYLEDSSTKGLWDYKFYCFGGLVKCYRVDFDRFIDHHTNYFTSNGEMMQMGDVSSPPDFNKEIPVPKNLEKLKELAEKLACTQPFLRTDFYDVDDKIYFGEMTFYPDSGFGKFIYDGNDEMLGSWLRIPDSLGGGYFLIYKGIILKLQKKINRLTDYKFFCFNGSPRFLYVATNSTDEENEKETFLDLNWEYTSFKRADYPEHNLKPIKPINFSKMIEFSKILSNGFSFLRVDFYESNGNLYCGELTFSPGAGFLHFVPEYADEKIGEMITLCHDSTPITQKILHKTTD